LSIQKCPLSRLQAAHQHLAAKLIAQTAAADLWLGHRVKVVDGTGLSMPDRPVAKELLKQWSGQ
jgi:hypothetical protein